MKKVKKVHGKIYNVVMAALIAILLIITILLNVFTLGVYKVTLNNYFTSFESADEGETTQDDWYDVATEIESEGAVLLKNDDNTLPLTDVTKVNLLGYRSYNHVFSGTGSGATDSSNAVMLKDALEADGIVNNPVLEESGLYTVSLSDETEGEGLFARFMGAGFDLTGETPVSEFAGDCSFENLYAYSNVAIVTLGRVGGEGSDLTSADPKQLDGAETFLALSDTEKELLESARNTFDTLIVIVNSGNAMELGCLEDYDVDAALWVGDVGCRGMEAVADILTGKVNPSGRLVDTYAYSATSAPSYINFGNFEFSNAKGTYVNYAEGIYVGYRWYETADAEGFFDGESNQYGDAYDAVVQFPFGYGMSYTFFDESITGGTADGTAIAAGDELNIEVTVQNSGDVAGKDVVELYYTAPYTNGGLEKSAVELIGFEKTDMLDAGESQTMTVSFNADDLASFDSTADEGNGAYVLEAGEYRISLRSDAHTELGAVTFNVEEDIVYSESGAGGRSSDKQIASNQFTNADNGMTYLSRADGFANYEEVLAQKADTASESVLYLIENPNAYEDNYDEVDVSYKEGEDYGASGDLTLADMRGLDYDDPKWDDLLSQMSVEDMKKLIGEGGWSTAAIESIGKKQETHIDSSNGLVCVVSTTPILATAYPSSVVQASTWNRTLIEKFGQYYSDEAHSFSISGLYAPSLNIHRSPFGGRNYEYYSEDGLLSGEIAAGFVKGAGERGMITYMKHFALNEQETNRGGVFTFANEQSIREVYIKGFEVIVKSGNSTALMSSMNNIGDACSVTHEGLLTEVLRNEWGFTGFVITDAQESVYQGAIDHGLRAGNDMWLSATRVEANISTDADIYYAKRACKDILYTEANAEVSEINIAPWKTWVAIADVVLALLIVLCVVLLVRNVKAAKKQD